MILSWSQKIFKHPQDEIILRPIESSLNQLAFKELTEKHGEALPTFRSSTCFNNCRKETFKPSNLVNIALKNSRIIWARQPQSRDAKDWLFTYFRNKSCQKQIRKFCSYSLCLVYENIAHRLGDLKLVQVY